jgi:beta-N-acetylhexosaminidase
MIEANSSSHNAGEQDDADRQVVSRRRLSRRHFLAGSAAAGLALAHGHDVAASDQEEELVAEILRSLSIERRIAQMFVFQAAGTQMTPWFDKMLTDVHPGGIIFVQPNIGTADQIRTFVKQIHESNTKLPPLVSIDQEGGDVIRLAGDPSPGAMVLGGMSDADVRAKSKDRGRFLTGFGFDVNFAPVADVAYAKTSTMYFRSFGSDPKVVAKKVAAVVKGSQAVRVMGAAKHFPGHGRTAVDSHKAIPTVDLSKDDWSKSDALPFQAAVNTGVEMVMVGHLKYPQWDDRPMSLSKVAVKTLRTDLDFHGLIVTDDLGMGALAGIAPFDVLDRAVDAGMDILLYTVPPTSWDALIDHVAKRVRYGDVSKKRIDATVKRIIRTKIRHFRMLE